MELTRRQLVHRLDMLYALVDDILINGDTKDDQLDEVQRIIKVTEQQLKETLP